MAIARGTAVTPVTNSTGVAASTIATAAYNQAAGEVVVVLVRWEGTNTAPTGVTDTAGNTYNARTQGNDATNLQNVQIFDCLSTTANASNVITVTWPSAVATFIGLAPQRYTAGGAVTFNAQPTPATGTSTTPATAAFSAGQLAVGAVGNFSGLTTSSSNAGWTTQFNNSIGLTTQDRIDNPGGTYAAGATLSGSAPWVISAASYTEAATGPTINTQPTNQTAKPGDSVTFSVSATASAGSLTYLWSRNGVSTGVTTSSYTFTPNYPADYGALWSCAVTDSNGTVTTNNVAILWSVQTRFSPWKFSLLDAGDQDYKSELTIKRWF